MAETTQNKLPSAGDIRFMLNDVRRGNVYCTTRDRRIGTGEVLRICGVKTSGGQVYVKIMSGKWIKPTAVYQQ